MNASEHSHHKIDNASYGDHDSRIDQLGEPLYHELSSIVSCIAEGSVNMFTFYLFVIVYRLCHHHIKQNCR